ncbi:pyridoxal phosphate-dependent aminotransferase [Cysteiniphilum sp. 6C5]|uniref:pyridoxal phosphate-dependent aminotransferase n=1 Tax=unclassified Cysteiniphilum TaxID=2610889 RepID=UPI003F840807
MLINLGLGAIHSNNIDMTLSNYPNNTINLRLLEWLSEQYHVEIKPENFLFVPGATYALLLILLDLQHKNIYLPDFCYGGYLCLLRELVFKLNDYDYQNPYDVECHPESVFIWNYPNNPTGFLVKEANIGQWSEDITVISDDVYITPETYTASLLSENSIAKHNLYTIGSASKLFGLAGIRLGWVISSSDNITALKRRLHALSLGVPTSSLLELENINFSVQFESIMQLLKKNRDLCHSFCVQHGIYHLPLTETSYYLLLDVSQFGIESCLIKDLLLAKYSVVVMDLSYQDKAFLRINLGVQTDILAAGLSKINMALALLRNIQ